MAQSSDKKENRGLASAPEATRKKVAKLGGEAYHEKRGKNGSDSRSSTS